MAGRGVNPDLSVGHPGQPGSIPGLVGRKDVVVIDELAHNSIQEGARLAQAGGARIATFAHNRPRPWRQRFRN